MKTNDRRHNTWLLCLVLTVALYALPGCQTQPAQEPTSAPYPEPATLTAAQPTQEPTLTTVPEPPTATVAPPTREPTSAPSPEPPTATVEQGPSAQEPTATEMRTFPRVTVEQLKQWMDAGEPLFFIDARSSDAWNTGTTKVPGALRVPPHDVESHLGEIPKDRRLIIYCT